MKNKSGAIMFLSLAMFAFLATGCENPQKIKKLESENGILSQMIVAKDAKIKMLGEQLNAKQKELDSTMKQLTDAKKEIDNLNKKAATLMAPPETLKK